MNDLDDLPEKPIWEKHTARGLYTIDKVRETPSDSDKNEVWMYMVNRTSVRDRNKAHEVRYYGTQAQAEAAALQHDRAETWSTDGEIVVA